MLKILSIELAVALGLFASLALSLRIGRRIGHLNAEAATQFGVIQGASLALLGLLIGFTFSGAIGRFVDRQDIIVQEANAIGTAWLRADLLPELQRDAMKASLRRYAELRLSLFETVPHVESQAIIAQLVDRQREMWSAATKGLNERPAAVEVVVESLNELFDLLNTRNAANQRHAPLLVLFVLVACSMVSMATIGYGIAGAHRSLRAPAIALMLLIAGVLWTTIDLDYPRLGMIQLNDQPLRDALVALRE